MEKVKKRNGISLIVLVITILVMIILAGVVIVNMSENNPIEKAKEARFKEDLTAIGEELELFVAHKLAENSSFKKESLNASTKKLEYNTKTDAKENMYTVFPSLKGTKYANQIEVIAGNLYYKSPDKKEIAWLKDMGVYYTGKVTGTVIIEGDTLVGVSPDYVNTGTLVIPNTVKKISRGAFAGCEDIHSVIIPEGVTEIPVNCFYGCKNLVSVQVPSTVTSIQSKAFAECLNLASISTLENVSYIGSETFFDCKSLKEISLKNIINIDQSAFRWCNSLAKVDFGSKLNSIGFIAFGNTALTEAIIPNTIKTIGGSAFYDTDTLKTVKIGEDVPGSTGNTLPSITLGDSIIRNCDGIQTITIASNPSFVYDGNVRYSKDKTVMYEVPANKGNFVIPSTVKRIDNGAYLNNSKTTAIDVPEGVEIIGANAFNTCKALTSVTLPRTVTEIGKSIIGSSMLLTNMTIHAENNNYYMDKGSIVHKYTNPNGGEEREIIGTICSTSGAYDMTENITILGEFAFGDCTKITSLKIGSNVKQMKGHSLYMATGLTSLTIPGNVKRLEDDAIYFATGLKTITVEEGVQYIGHEAFRKCKSLEQLNLPSTLDTIGHGVLGGTEALKNVQIANIPGSKNKFTGKGKAIYTADLTELVSYGGNNAEKVINVPANATVIRPYAIYENPFVQEVHLQAGVERLQSYAIVTNTNLARVVVPNTVTSIGENSFVNTPKLAEILIDKPEGSIAGTPWGATQGTKAVVWKGR